jgi:hypothetical protein
MTRSALDEIRAALRAEASPQPAAPAPQQAPGSPAACPFTFGPWIPRTDADALPGEAQRAIYVPPATTGATLSLLAWQRRAVVQWVPLQDEPDGTPVHCHQIADLSGQIILSSTDQQTVLEGLAARAGL